MILAGLLLFGGEGGGGVITINSSGRLTMGLGKPTLSMTVQAPRLTMKLRSVPVLTMKLRSV